MPVDCGIVIFVGFHYRAPVIRANRALRGTSSFCDHSVLPVAGRFSGAVCLHEVSYLVAGISRYFRDELTSVAVVEEAKYHALQLVTRCVHAETVAGESHSFGPQPSSAMHPPGLQSGPEQVTFVQ